MKRAFLIVVLIFCSTLSAKAVDLQPLIDDYLNKRYYSHEQVSLDFEHFVGYIEKIDTNLSGILVLNKNGTISLLEMSHATQIQLISRSHILPNYRAFQLARAALLKEASKDLSSVVKLQIIFQ